LLRLGIVSSYGEECGNASNTHVVKREFAKHYDVEIIAVNAELLGRVNRKPDLRAVYATIEACDVVNIQFESGLYGDTPSVIAANVYEMIRRSKRLIFRMHRVYPQAKKGVAEGAAPGCHCALAGSRGRSARGAGAQQVRSRPD